MTKSEWFHEVYRGQTPFVCMVLVDGDVEFARAFATKAEAEAFGCGVIEGVNNIEIQVGDTLDGMKSWDGDYEFGGE